jgi:heme-degrading monooxygenase HmoA
LSGSGAGEPGATAPTSTKPTTTRPLIKKALGVQTFREDRENETEFMTISYWESVEAMSKFTGGDPRKVHHLERDKEFLIELPKEVQILRLLKSHGITGFSQDQG